MKPSTSLMCLLMGCHWTRLIRSQVETALRGRKGSAFRVTWLREARRSAGTASYFFRLWLRHLPLTAEPSMDGKEVVL